MPEKSSKTEEKPAIRPEPARPQQDPSMTPTDGGEQYVKQKDTKKGQRYEGQPPVEESDVT